MPIWQLSPVDLSDPNWEAPIAEGTGAVREASDTRHSQAPGQGQGNSAQRAEPGPAHQAPARAADGDGLRRPVA